MEKARIMTTKKHTASRFRSKAASYTTVGTDTREAMDAYRQRVGHDNNIMHPDGNRACLPIAL